MGKAPQGGILLGFLARGAERTKRFVLARSGL